MINFANYIKRVLKELNPILQINGDSLEIINKILNNVYIKIINDKKFPNMMDVIDNLFLRNENEMKKEIIQDIQKSLYQYENNNKVKIPFLSIKFNVDEKISYLIGSVLQYITVDILEISGNITRKYGKTRITVEYITEAIKKDKQVKAFIQNNRIINFKEDVLKSPQIIKKIKSSRRKQVKKSSRRKSNRKSSRKTN
jgi:hypothetical protein